MVNLLSYHRHPRGMGKDIFGLSLIPGNRLLKDDMYPVMYPHPTGWMPIPESIIGQILREHHPVPIIRPDRPALTP